MKETNAADAGTTRLAVIASDSDTLLRLRIFSPPFLLSVSICRTRTAERSVWRY